ncbi:MAG: hypothetical protein P1U58_17995 [Verrucomicrobiales bacterium]|nr:hypothetical protein [Verrucomicrobiales bacterium]
MRIRTKLEPNLLLSIIAVIFGLLSGDLRLLADESMHAPLKGWETVIVAPRANIAHDGRTVSDTDIKELPSRFLELLEERGISSRKAKATDKRYLKLSMRAMLGHDSPFILRVQHIEPVSIVRAGEEVWGVSTTWETETTSYLQSLSSTQWPVIRDAMNLVIDELAAAISNSPNNPAAEQAGAGQPEKRPESVDSSD